MVLVLVLASVVLSLAVSSVYRGRDLLHDAMATAILLRQKSAVITVALYYYLLALDGNTMSCTREVGVGGWVCLEGKVHFEVAQWNDTRSQFL